jgi:sugar lactone lactonase YvrE
MNNNQNIIRIKAQVENVFELNKKEVLYRPREDSKSNLYVCSQVGEIIKFDEKGKYQSVLTITGQPTCIAFDQHNEMIQDNASNNDSITENFYFTDVASSIIYQKKTDSEKSEVIIKDFEGKPFKGPTSIALNLEENTFIFTDAGYFSSTSMSRPFGSIYHYDIETKSLNSILLNSLAYPYDIVMHINENMSSIYYVSETFQNRILRIIKNPKGIFQISVFYVFNGRVGPTALTCDIFGNLYVGRYEYQNKEGTVDGLISVLNKEGNLIGEIEVPKLCEFTGLYIPKRMEEEIMENENQKPVEIDTWLYFTDKNFPGVKRIKLNQFINDIEKP